jgi:hypothetical protein
MTNELEKPAVEEASLAGPNVVDFLAKTIAEAKAILFTYENYGDWYGCLQHAVSFLEGCQQSGPPDGTTSVPGFEPEKIRRP